MRRERHQSWSDMSKAIIGIGGVVWVLVLLLVSTALTIGAQIPTQEITFTAEQNLHTTLVSVDTARRLTITLAYEYGATTYGGVWSPDGARLAFISGRNGNNELYLLDGGVWQQITHTPEHEGHPYWSPDGERIVFERWSSIDVYLDQIDLTTRIQQRVVEPQGISPAWSPDGTRLAYVGIDSGIYVIDFVNTDVLSITLPNVLLNAPAWSPDGAQLAFYSYGNTAGELHTYHFASGEITDLTQTPTIAESSPSWSPDGTQIAYIALPVNTTAARLFVLDLASGTTQQISDFQAWDYPPSWRP